MEDVNAHLGRDIAKYSSISGENESFTEKYVHLIRANEEAPKEILPVKKEQQKEANIG